MMPSPYIPKSDLDQFIQQRLVHPEDLNALIACAQTMDIYAGNTLLHEGQLASHICILKTGLLQVQSTQVDGSILSINQITPHNLIGEHALFHPNSRHRASVIALEKSEVWLLPLQSFHAFCTRHSGLLAILKDRMHQRDVSNLTQRSHLFAALQNTSNTSEFTRRYVETDEVIFHKGSQGEHFYILMSGSVSLFDPDTDHLFSIVGIGQSFGERALKTDDARSASAKADTPSVLFEIPHTHFNQTLQTDPTFQRMLDAMDFMNRLPGMGTSTSFPSTHNGEPCIVRIYHLDDGSELKTMWFPFVETFHLQSSSTPTQAFEWTDNPNTSNTRRRLLFNAQWHLSEMIATGKWRDLPWLIESALLKRVFESDQIDQFVETGRLPRPILISDVQEGIVCHCLGLTLHTLQQQIASGCTTRSALQQQTGCGMVCGGCIPTLDLLTGQSNWIPVQISRTPITEHVVLIRLSNEHVTLPKWTAGQHIVLSGKVFADSEIQWIERSYTIVSSENTPHLEIAVKREALGLFSRWLCDGEATLKDLRMSHPKGDVFWDPERPLICFVAGIGITPAISIVRTAVDVLKTGSQIQPIHIVYAFHSQQDAAFLDEIKEDAQMYDDIHVNLIESKKDGRISKATISAYIQESNAYLICGPLSFMDLVEGVLTPHIPSEQIHTEKFLHQPKATNSTVQDIEPRASFIHQAYWVGTALFILIAFFFSSTTGQMLMTTGHPNVGHEALSCHECHTPSMGSTRQQAQALIQHWLNNRTVVSWQYEPVNNDVCIRCHDRSNDVHAAHLFQESKYADIRDTLGPERCISCHHEHRGVRVTQTMTFCQSCHQDMNFKNDPLQPPNSPTHSDLVAQAQWDTCLGCHDYHGTHQWDSPTEFEQRIQASDVESYLNGAQPLYTSPKEQP